MTLTFQNINKMQVKQHLLKIQKQLTQKNLEFTFKILDKNPLDEFFDVEVYDAKIFKFLKRNMSNFV